MTIRAPVCTIVGHVDHGKTSILDSIRGTTIVKGEAGGITQAIGASIIPLETIRKICGPLLDSLKIKLTIPGLLFIDTPGHVAFTSLRKRGGNLADIAIVVIDINEGVMPQTKEAIEILKSYKTPFIIALNKIDLIEDYHEVPGQMLANLNAQSTRYQAGFEKKLYEIVGKLHELGFESERFDRVSDYTKQVAMVPTSAKTGIGIPELLMVLTGLAQKYLESCLECDKCASAKGIILEVKEEKGLGKTLDVIIYDGCLKINDMLVIGSMGEPIVTKIRALFQPKPLMEMRDKKTKFDPVKEVVAATGVKISAKEIDNVIAGMPIRSVIIQSELDKAKEEVQEEIEEVIIETEEEGIIVKADTLGSLEAINHLLKEKQIPIRKATIGNITKKDMTDAESMFEKDPLQTVILGFNVKVSAEAEPHINSTKAKIILNDVIYRLIEDYEKWVIGEKRRQEESQMDLLVRPFKLKMLGKGYIFRQNNPAVFGIEVLAGIAKPGMPLMKADGSDLKKIKSMQCEMENLEKAEKKKQCAVSVDGITIGRQLGEEEILYSNIPEEDFRKLKDLKKYLSKEEVGLLKEIADIKRKLNPVWGI
jgi:translation initiation factor 5B